MWRTKAEDKKSENGTSRGPPEEKKKVRNQELQNWMMIMTMIIIIIIEVRQLLVCRLCACIAHRSTTVYNYMGILRVYVHTKYIHTYVHTHIHTYIHIHTRMHT